MTPQREQPGFPKQHQPPAEPAPAPPATVRAMPADHPEQVFFRFDLLRSLQLHGRLAIGIFALAVTLATAYVLRMWPIYEAQSLVYIQPAPPRLMERGPSNSWPFDSNTYESYIQQQVHNVTRSDVLLGALHKLPVTAWRQSAESEQAAADRLGRAIEVTRVGTGYQVSIAVRASDAALAAQISNAVAASFIESATRELRSGDAQRIELLREERDRVLKELASAREEQEDLNKKLGVAAIGSTNSNPFDEQISQIRAELVKARTANDEAAARLTTMATGQSTSSAALDAAADEIVSADAGMVSMKTSLNQRRSVLITQMANLTPNHPQYKQDAQELAQINASLDSMTKDLRAKAGAHIQQRLKSDLERTSGVEAKLNAQLAQLTAAAGGATPRLQRSNELAADIQRLQSRFSAVDEQYRNLTMENNAPGAVYLSAAAVPPLHASQSGVLRNALVLAFAGLLLGVVAALTAHNLDPHIYIATDVERVLGFAPMAQLPDFSQVSEIVAEEYMLRLASAVEYAYQHGGLHSCIFTGIAPGSGVTTVATRVTAMLEAMGRSTVLVDASGTPPPLAAPMNGPEGATDLVATQRGSRTSVLLQQMTQESSEDTIVLSDTAPLLVSGETEYLARFVNSAIVIIQSGVTTREQLREVAVTLQRLQVATVGFVLNRIALPKANPSFRRSVKAVEQHLQAQGRAYSRHTVRSQASAGPELENAHASSAAAQQKSAVPAGAPAAQSPATPSPQTDATLKSEESPHLTARPLRKEPSHRAQDPVAAAAQSAAQAIPARHAERAAPAQPSTPAAPAAARASRPPEPPRPSVATSPQVPNVQPSETIETDLDDIPYSAASRLGGLRNLFTSLGLKGLDKDPEFRGPEPEPEPRFRRQPERPVYAEAYVASPEGTTAPADPSITAVTAPPEFLPPRALEIAEKEKEPARPANPAPIQRDPEELQTLPSWRGQYRRRR